MTKSMSSTKQKLSLTTDFAVRFAEACGTTEAARIQRLLNISYQAAKNYLSGRLPDARVLITISERTPYSIHWLLTGEGEKFSIPTRNEDTLPLARQISELIRQEVKGAVSEALAKHTPEAEERTIVLRPDDVLTETARKSDKMPTR